MAFTLTELLQYIDDKLPNNNKNKALALREVLKRISTFSAEGSTSNNGLIQISTIMLIQDPEDPNGVAIDIPIIPVEPIWEINGYTYTKHTRTIIPIPSAAASDLYRTDRIVGDMYNNIYRVPGTERADVGIPPLLPPNTVEITQVQVYGNTVDNSPTSSTKGYISKSSRKYHIINLPSTSDNILTLGDEITTYKVIRLGDSGTIEGFIGDMGATPYDGMDIYIKNETEGTIDLAHNSGIVSTPFKFKGEVKLTLEPQQLAHLKFNKVDNRVELVGAAVMPNLQEVIDASADGGGVSASFPSGNNIEDDGEGLTFMGDIGMVSANGEEIIAANDTGLFVVAENRTGDNGDFLVNIDGNGRVGWRKLLDDAVTSLDNLWSAKKISDELATKQPKDLVYPTIADMLANQSKQVEGVVIRVDDASADPNITFPAGETKLQAYYEFNGVATGSINVYTLISAPYGNHTDFDFEPSDYDLDEFQNVSTDPFITESKATHKGGYEGTAQDIVELTQSLNDITELRTTDKRNTLNVLGYHEAGDGGGGLFYWDATSEEDDNGGTIIQPTGVTTGRFKRLFSGSVNVKWFGAKTDGTTDCTSAVNSALTALLPRTGLPSGWGLGTLYFPKGIYLVNGTITINSAIGLRFCGDGEYSTVIKRTNDAGILFDFGIYISLSFEQMAIRHETATEQSTWTSICFNLNGVGGGRNFNLKNISTKGFETLVKHTGTVNNDTTYIDICTFYDCKTFVDSENSQGILNQYSNCTWGGKIQQLFHVAGHWQTVVINGNIVVDGVTLKYKNILGKYNQRGFTFINTKWEFTSAHAVLNTVPKLIEAEGVYTQVNVKLIDSGLSGGATPHIDTKCISLKNLGNVRISINGGSILGKWEFEEGTGYLSSRASNINLENCSVSNPSNWISDETGLSGKRIPPIIFKNVSILDESLSPINLTLSRFGPPFLSPRHTTALIDPLKSVQSFFSNTTDTTIGISFFNQQVVINKLIWKYQRGGAGQTGRIINIYSDSSRTTLIATFEIPDTAENNTPFIIPTNNDVVTGIYVSVVMPSGTTTMIGHLIADYTSA